MLSLVIAETVTHANAVIRWIGLNPDEWIGVAYGSTLNDIYKDCFLVRPLTGVREEHGDWFIEKVIPRIAGEVDTVPRGWRPQAEEPVEQEYAQKHIWA
ncbi:hypothetical protein [Methylobacterium sp. WL120]|uniref:hypothetical protein n=1 Tax=Methylobacterium sp. WL120 TaxID=2603887 RepID=UPI0011C7F555|nr:hypothetical protein [Methylobacterium sp. WL120]TXM68180.1 hypothetical protein FV229_08370 [Methylobacterium sp. WL120]